MATIKQVENSGQVVFQKTVTKLGEKYLFGSKLKFTLCDLNDLTTRPYGNLFSSFNLPITNLQRRTFIDTNTPFSGGQNQNAFKNLLLDSNNNFINKIIVAEIPQNEYGELIDGKTIEIRVPLTSGNITCYGSYFGYKPTLNNQFSDTNNESAYFGIKPSSNDDNNSNIAYLFSNEISKPKTKIVENKVLVSSFTINSPISNSQRIDRTLNFNVDPNKFYSIDVNLGLKLRRVIISNPSRLFDSGTINAPITSIRSTSFNTTVSSSTISLSVLTNESSSNPTNLVVTIYESNIDQTLTWSKWTNNNKFPTAPSVYNGKLYANFTDNVNNGLLIDEPVGIAYLDKGFCVFTHPIIVNNFQYSASTSSGYDGITSGSTYNGPGTFTQTYFNSASQAYIKYDSITTEFVQSIMAIAMPNEFYISKNPTFEEVYGVNGVNNITSDPVYITEVGLYNEFGELIAIAKTSEPIAKTKANIVSFNIQLKL